MADIETVKVQSEHFEGGVVINKSDFDEKTMKLFVEPEKESGSSGRTLGGGDAADSGDDDGNAGGGDETFTHAGLMKKGKDDLIEIAKGFGLDYPTPDEVTKDVIAKAILDKQ